MSEPLHWLDATELAANIREGKISSAAALEHFLERIERINPALNAVVALDVKAARARAAEADAALARGEVWGPLHGVPMTVKDVFEVVGMPTTAGIVALKDHYPKTNATGVQHLLDAGAIIFGKTNVPTGAADFQTCNDVYGITGNAWNPDYVCGGSSGGSAVALAAGLTPLEFGSDIGGSTRNPAHFNNVFGMRPTWGTISGIGHVPGMPGSLTIDDCGTPGPMARSARDLRLAYDIVRGSEPRFGHRVKEALPELRTEKLSELRVGLWMSDPRGPVDHGVAAVLDQALQKLRAAGLTRMEEAKPDIDVDEAQRLFVMFSACTVSGGASDEERQQMRKELEQAEKEGRVHPRADWYQAALLAHNEWIKLSQKRNELWVKWTEYFKTYDVMLSPIFPLNAIPHGEHLFRRKVDINGVEAGRTMVFWAGQQVIAHLPAVVFPAGFTADGMPVGLQVTAPRLGDYQAITASGLFADAIGANKLHPSYPGD